MRTPDERVADVRRWLDAARRVHAERERWAPALVASTGLSREGVELGFESLERDASDDELRRLVSLAGSAAHVHVVLSANVFVAALRAIVLARAAAPRVTLRPSPRDPVLAEALVAAAGDPAVALVGDRDVAHSGADALHVYGRDATIDEVRRAARPGVLVVGHGAGLGAVVISSSADLDAVARALARDVATFDQRGCLSPRLAVVVGSEARAGELAAALHATLTTLDATVPRGRLSADESRDAARWRDALAFAGTVHAGEGHAVAAAQVALTVGLPPPGRHVLVVAADDEAAARTALAPLERHIVTLGLDTPDVLAGVFPAARRARIGFLQRPALDGPVDLRARVDTVTAAVAVT